MRQVALFVISRPKETYLRHQKRLADNERGESLARHDGKLDTYAIDDTQLHRPTVQIAVIVRFQVLLDICGPRYADRNGRTEGI
jgi:hypothetical protein